MVRGILGTTVLSAATTSDGDRLRISPLLTPAVPESFHLRMPAICGGSGRF